MSTRNYYKDFIEIPIKKLQHHYFINMNGDIIWTDPNGKKPKPIYKWNMISCHKPIKIFNYADNKYVYLIPSTLYMISYYGYLPFPIIESVPGIAECMEYDLPEMEIVSDDKVKFGDIIFKRSNLFSNHKQRRVYVSENGCIYDEYRRKIVRQRFNHKMYNYRYYSSYKVHQIVYEAWIGPLYDDMEIHHKDNNDWNNDKSNLVQLTREEHQLIHGKIQCSVQKVHDICKLLEQGLQPREISNKLDVKIQTVQCIRSGERFKDITSQYKFPKYINRGASDTTDETIHKICKLLGEHKLNNAEIGKMHELNKYTVQDIRKGVSWRRISDKYNFVRESDLGGLKKVKPIKIDEYRAGNQSISVEQVKEIWSRLQKNEKLISISRSMNVSYSIVKKIKYRSRWTNITDQLGPLPDDICDKKEYSTIMFNDYRKDTQNPSRVVIK